MKHFNRGFSLIEVVLALGVVSFSVLALLGLLVVGNETNKSARDETMAAQLAANEFARLRSLPAATFPTVYQTRFFNNQLRDLGTSKSSAVGQGAAYEFRVNIVTPAAPAPADRVFNAEVRFPAAAPDNNQTVYRFTTLMNLPAS